MTGIAASTTSTVLPTIHPSFSAKNSVSFVICFMNVAINGASLSNAEAIGFVASAIALLIAIAVPICLATVVSSISLRLRCFSLSAAMALVLASFCEPSCFFCSSAI